MNKTLASLVVILMASCSHKDGDTYTGSDRHIGDYIYHQIIGREDIFHVDQTCPDIDRQKPIDRIPVDTVQTYSRYQTIPQNACPTCVSDEDYQALQFLCTDEDQ